VSSSTGGAGGGGARMTAFGGRVLAAYRDMERAVDRALDPALARFSGLLR
jgi:molybdate transport system regulatory protein